MSVEGEQEAQSWSADAAWEAVCHALVPGRAHTDQLTEGPRRSRHALEELVADAVRYRQTKDFRELIEFVSRFRQYKPFNGLLVDVQRPGSTYVAPAGRWRQDYGHRVKPGATPIVILQMFGPVMFVFDVADVEPIDGTVRPLPTDVTRPFDIPDESVYKIDERLGNLERGLIRDGVRVVDASFGPSLAGRVRASQGPVVSFEFGKRPPRSIPIQSRYVVEINKAQRGVTRLATLAHELGHLYCGHVGSHDERLWPNRWRTDDDVAEIEAETVAAIVVRRYAPSASLPPFLHQYLGEHGQIPDGVNLERIHKAAGEVTDLLAGPVGPRRARSAASST